MGKVSFFLIIPFFIVGFSYIIVIRVKRYRNIPLCERIVRMLVLRIILDRRENKRI